MKSRPSRSLLAAALILVAGACTPAPPRTETGSGGAPGTGTGGASSTGGAVGTGSGGSTTGSGGTLGTGTGGDTGSGSGGDTGSGTGGSSGTGGRGTTGSGGATNTGGAPATGTGGRANTGGSTGTGGSATGTGGAPMTGGTKPCDIYAADSAPCVAAHSTVRALFSAYSGKLYQLRKKGTTTTMDISTKAAGGFADVAAHDAFCTGATCEVTIVYDQSGHKNDVYWQGTDSPVGNPSNNAPKAPTIGASKETLMVGGNKVYPLWIDAATAMWQDGSKNGMPLGATKQSIYMVTSGTHVNNQCCFDYGSGETTRKVGACGSMDTVNFSKQCWFNNCSGTGPWVQWDPECGVFPGGTDAWPATQKSFPMAYVTAMQKSNGGTEMTLKGGDATTGMLSTVFKGAPKYKPSRQGGIVLGSGGDCCYSNSNASVGTFYEGAIMAGYPSDATDEMVHANVVATKYGSTTAALQTSTSTGQ